MKKCKLCGRNMTDDCDVYCSHCEDYLRECEEMKKGCATSFWLAMAILALAVVALVTTL